jgi:hypothetical protein
MDEAKKIKIVKTKEISEAAIFYLHDLFLEDYVDRFWIFRDENDITIDLRSKLINKEIQIEPLGFMDAIRWVKSFANEAVNNGRCD